MFDLIYITWFVHVTTALVSTKFWYLFWIVSPFTLSHRSSNTTENALLIAQTSRFPDTVSTSYQTFSSRTSSPPSPVPPLPPPPLPLPELVTIGIAAPAAGAQDGVTSEIVSKRQEKLRKRVEKGDPRAIAKNQEKQLLQQKIEKQNAAKNKNQD